MSQNVCNICGANYEYRNGRWKCPACGAFKAEELSNEEVTLLYNAAQKLRLSDFDEAEKAYADIIEKFPKNPDGYWGRLLSRYGIKYEEDFDGRKIPTCYATSIESVITDKDYLKAIELADEDTRAYYTLQAEYIEKVRKEWVEKARKEKPYDIFICYKDSDLANGIDRTQDSIAAQELYIHLTEQGYRVFFSRESLRGKVGEKYEPYIFNALSTAKVMLVYGSSADYITSTWLKNEWTRYEKRLQAGEKKPNSLIVACDGFSPSELPKVLSSMQCFDATKRSFYSDLDILLKRLIKGEEKPKPVVTEAPEKKKSKKLPIAISLAAVLIAIFLCILIPNLLADKTTASLIDSKYGVVITAQDEIFDEDSSLTVKKTTDGSEHNDLVSAVNSAKSIDLQNVIIYDINCNEELTANVTVRVAYSKSNSNSEVKVYYVSDTQSTIEEHACIYDNGFVEFKTNHLSFYVVGEVLSSTETPGGNDDPVTPSLTYEEGVLQVGVCADYEPYEYVEGGQFKGIEIDILKAIAAELDLEIRFENDAFEELLGNLNDKEVDCIIGLIETDERNEVATATNAMFSEEDWDYIIYLNKDCTKLKTAINNAISKLISNGTVTDIIADYAGSGSVEPSDKVTISFDANGGTGEMASITVERNEYIDMPTNEFVRDGYSFVGWSSVASGVEWEYPEGAKCKATASKTYYARWQENPNDTIKAHFHANDGSETFTTLDLLGSHTFLFPSCEFVRAGYSFDGWCINESGTSQLYAPNSSFTVDETTTILNFYATWLPNENILNLDPNGGNYKEFEGWVDDIKIQTGKSYSLPTNPFERDGFTFVGWSTTPTGSVEYEDRAQYTMGTNSEYTLYAVWSANTNSLILKANDGTTNERTVNIKTNESKNIPLNTFTRNGYTFKGWSSTSNGTVEYDDGALYTMSSSSETLYAIWETISYTVTFMNGSSLVAEIPFTVETNSVSEPPVPAKQCYIGSWSTYSLAADNIIVYAEYTLNHSNLQAVSRTEPQCNKEGNIEYWFCNGCNKKYTTQNGNIESDSVVIEVVNCIFENNYCKWCGRQKPSSEGLSFESVSGGYSVSGINECPDTEIIIPATYNGQAVVGISDMAFYENDSITSVFIPNSVLSIGEKAFAYCSNLTTVSIGCGVEKIGMLAFYTTGINDVYIYDLAKWCNIEFGGSSFYSNPLYSANRLFVNNSYSNIITIPEGTTKINAYAFSSFEGLSKIIIPSTVTHIDEKAFYACSALATIEVSDDNSVYHDAGNCLIKTQTKTIIQGSSCSEIPKDGSVTRINSLAFASCDFVNATITIPNCIEYVGYGAFANCDVLIYCQFTEIPSEWDEEWNPDDCGVVFAPSYAITYNANGGENAPQSQTKIHEVDLIITTSEPTRVGYTFLGWAESSTAPCPTYYSGSAFQTDSKTTLYAIWEANEDTAYTINRYFENANSDDYELQAETLYGTTGDFVTPAVNTYSHYNSPDAETITIAADGSTVVNYYYTRETFTVTFVENGGNEVNSKIYKYEQKLTNLPVATRTGYTFGGWFIDVNQTNTADDWVLYGDTYVYAWWKEETKVCNLVYDGYVEGSDGLTIHGYNGGGTIVVAPSYIGGMPVIAIGNQAFQYNSRDYGNESEITQVVIPDTVTSIGENAFLECRELNSVTLSNNLSQIGLQAFFNCESLEEISLPSTLTTLGNYAFGHCTSLKTVNISEGITSIEGAFAYCSSLEDIQLPNSIRHMDDAFVNCTSLKTVNIPTGVATFASTFYYCSNLQSITIPNNITTIGDAAFMGSGITSISIPSSVTTIGNNAFYECAALERISMDIGINNLLIYSNAFGNCSNLISVNITDLNRWCSSSFSNTFSNPLVYADYLYLSGELVTSLDTCTVEIIPHNAFTGYSGFKNITIPDSVTEIRQSAFDGCSNLETVVLGNSVETIWQLAFANCPKLTSVKIQSNITSIPKSLFYNCSQLSSIIYPDSMEQWSFVSKGTDWNTNTGNYTIYCFDGSISKDGTTTRKESAGLSYEKHYNGYYIVCGIGTCSDTQIFIPSTYNGYPVQKIGDRAFENCTEITYVNIPDSVTTIGGSVFSGCSALKEIIIPNSVTEIGEWTFANCTSIETIDLPDNLTTISDYLFEKCTGLKTIVIPDNVTYVGYSFYGCTSLETVTLGKNVTDFYCYAFGNSGVSTLIIKGNVIPFDDTLGGTYVSHLEGIDNLKTVIIEGNITEIRDDEFRGCSLLETVVLPEGVLTIGSGAFYECSALKDVNIPNSVTSIGSHAFFGCTSLTTITIPNSVTTIDYYAFWKCTQLTSVTFINPNGWWYSSNSYAGNGTEILSSSLADPATAATLITSSDNYAKYYWRKS